MYWLQYFSQFSVFGLADGELDDEEGENVFAWFVDKIVLFELFGDEMFVINEERVEFVGHEFWFFMEGYWLCYVFAGEDVGFSYRCSANHDFIIVLVLFYDFVEVQVAVSEIHDVIKSLFADGSEIFRCFELPFVDDEIHHNFIFVFVHEFGLVDGIDWVIGGVPME